MVNFQTRGHSRRRRLSDWNAVEQRYKDKRGLIDGRRLGCQATVQGDIVIDVPPESQVHKQVVRKRAEVLDITLNPSTRIYYVEVEEPDMHNPSGIWSVWSQPWKANGSLKMCRQISAYCQRCNPFCAKAAGRLPAPSTMPIEAAILRSFICGRAL